MNEVHEAGEAYSGGAELLSDATAIPVEVTLRGYFEPLDGRFRWYGRISPDPELARTQRSGATLVLNTPHGRAVGRISDIDPWGRFRISGTGSPPF